MSKYLISKLNLFDNTYTLHSPVKKLMEKYDDVIEQQNNMYFKFGKTYKGEKALRSRIRFGLTIGEDYEIDDRLPDDDKKKIKQIIHEEIKDLEERMRW